MTNQIWFYPMKIFFLPFSNMASTSSAKYESLTHITFPRTDVDMNYNNFQMKLLFDLVKKLLETLDSVTGRNITSVSAPTVYVKHIYSKQLLNSISEGVNEELLEWYIDTEDHEFMKKGHFFKIVMEPEESKNIAYLVLKRCSEDNSSLFYTAVKHIVDIPLDIFKLIKEVATNRWKLYSVDVLRRQLDVGDVHVDFDQIYDGYGESYCVQSIKSSSVEGINSFLSNYSDYEVVYSKIYYILKMHDNFLLLKDDLFVPKDYKLYHPRFYHLVANEDQSPEYRYKALSGEKKNEIENAELEFLEYQNKELKLLESRGLKRGHFLFNH